MTYNLIRLLNALLAENNAWPELNAAMRSAIGIPKFSVGEEHPVPISKVSKLPVLCCEALGGSEKKVLEAASVWYLFYCAANLIDKIQDNDPPETWWKSEGNGYALNAAVGLFATGANLLSNGLLELDLTKRSLIISDFYRSIIDAIGGQQQDLSKDIVLNVEKWKIIALAKSGSIFALACRIGAVVAGGGTDAVKNLGLFGANLGLIIQILNDIEEFADPKNWTQSFERFSVLRSLPIVYALDTLTQSARNEIIKSVRLGGTSEPGYERLRKLVSDTGASVFLEAEIETYKRQCRILLSTSLEVSNARNQLFELLDFISLGQS